MANTNQGNPDQKRDSQGQFTDSNRSSNRSSSGSQSGSKSSNRNR